MVTVPVAELPLTIEVGLTVTEVTCGERTSKSVESPTPPADAPITTAVLADTELVPIAKLTLSVPAGIVTLVGTCTTLELLSEIFTVNPAEGATPLRLTVAVADSPPRTELGESVTSASVAGVIERVAVFEVVPNLAVILADVLSATPYVENRKLVEDAPAGTVTVNGTTASLLEDVKFTVEPVLCAIPSRVTVPIETSPPTTAVGEIVIELSFAVLTVRLAVRDFPPAVAVSLTVWLLVTPAVPITNVVFATP
jgi:hypothetical protein